MARFAKRMTEEDFREWIRTEFYAKFASNISQEKVEGRDIVEYLLRNVYSYSGNYELFDSFPEAKKDLGKVQFDYENLLLALGINRHYGADDKLYFYERNNVCLMLCEAGGDWETPVWFVLYVDNKNKLRAYIPTQGNTYCTKYKCAYGSIIDMETDLSEEEAEQMDEEGQGLQADFTLLLDDAFSRIQAT